MTDITELAQRVKTEASAIDDTQWYLAKPSEIRLLVEALEKAQQRNGELETYSKTALEFREAARDENRHLKLELEIAEKRIAELKDAEQKLCAANVTLDARAELAERQLAEMVSRTVTVKMSKLKMLEDYLAEVAVEERKAILLGVRMEFHRALNAEGIKWEAE
ncbi:hypothetical protein [Klebsiella pneumoniae]|uniref:hypothetical protein n=1 Tax=Klebsiella pneumoniae TaxID=573 RepID=UPI0015D61EB8|nr:hypothetical protein [Klebsiella pneumoniae]